MTSTRSASGRFAVLICAAVAFAMPITAQETVPATLSLDEAVEIARRNNPSFLQSRNDLDLAEWDVRQAYAAFLPTASASSGVTWQGPGEQRLGSLTLGDLGFTDQPSYYFSSYNLGLSYSLDWATLKGPARAKAQRSATSAQIRAAEANLVARVTNAYVEALRQQAALTAARQQFESNRLNLRLAEAQLEVGQVTPLDVGLAEIQVGRAQVALLQAENALRTARMRLLQEMGVSVDQEFELVTTFQLSEPTWEVDELVELALRHNPTLEAQRRSKEAADVGVSAAKSGYLPSLSISTGWSGFTREASSVDFQIQRAQAQVAAQVQQCLQTNDLYARLADPLPPMDCSRYVFTDEQRRRILEENDQFPFRFERSPPSVSFGISIPIFQGLTRQRNVEAAKIQRDDLALQLREQELALVADISVGLANVRTAYRSAVLEARNRDLAEQQLRLARERYQLGAISFVELADAQTALRQAERDHLTAVFAYHDAVTNLETLVGTSLRN